MNKKHLPSTQYRITIDGEQKWFGQGAFESLAVCWLFPGKTVQIDCPCLDCGDPIRVEVKDGVILNSRPEEVISFVAVPFWKWIQDMAYAGSTMNFFRSEEHLRNWTRFDPAFEEGILPLNDLMKLFSGSYFKRRMDPDWVSHSGEYIQELLATMQEIGKTGPFWMGPNE